MKKKMKSYTEKFRHLIETYKHAWILLYAFIYFPWFSYLEKHVTTHFNVIHMGIDDHIPFCEFFIIPYLLWFAYVAGTVLHFFLKNKQDYYRLCAFLFVGMTVFLIISTVYPNGHYLRPHTFPRDNIFTRLVGWLYSTDTATNLFPSIHVYNSLGVHLSICNSQEFQQNRRIKTASFVLMSSIILATVFLKQHSMFDVLTAFIMAGVMYAFVYGKTFASQRQKSPAKSWRHI